MRRDDHPAKGVTAVTRRQALRRGGVAVAAVLALALPQAACAHPHAHDRRHRRDDFEARRRRRRRARRHERAEAPWFYCRPCRHRFADHGAFHAHLHHVHHVPFWRIPELIVRVSFGWIYYG